MAAPIDTPRPQGITPAPMVQQPFGVMAPAAPQAPPVANEDDQHIESLRKALIEVIMRQMNAPAPTPPRPMQPQPLGAAQAITATFRPQTAPFFQQQAQMGEASRYDQQQAQFEAALKGQQSAPATGVNLLEALQQPQIAQMRAGQNRLRSNFIPRDVNGEKHTIQLVYDPNNPTNSIEIDRGKNFVMPGVSSYLTDEGQAAIGTIDRTKGTIKPIKTESGAIAGAVPTQGTAASLASDAASLVGLQGLYNEYNTIHEETKGEAGWFDFAKQATGTMVGESKYGGRLAPRYAKYTSARRNALNTYIKAQTGAQFSVAEMNRYDVDFPQPWDPPDVARQKIQNLGQRAKTDMDAKLRLYHNAGKSAEELGIVVFGGSAAAASGAIGLDSDEDFLTKVRARAEELRRQKAAGAPK